MRTLDVWKTSQKMVQRTGTRWPIVDEHKRSFPCTVVRGVQRVAALRILKNRLVRVVSNLLVLDDGFWLTFLSRLCGSL